MLSRWIVGMGWLTCYEMKLYYTIIMNQGSPGHVLY